MAIMIELTYFGALPNGEINQFWNLLDISPIIFQFSIDI